MMKVDFPMRELRAGVIDSDKARCVQTLVNPACSQCQDEAKRRAVELKS